MRSGGRVLRWRGSRHRGGPAQIGRLVGERLSNPEIAAPQFMSSRTVEYHLHKVFTKLDITSRNQLHGALASRTRQRRTP